MLSGSRTTVVIKTKGGNHQNDAIDDVLVKIKEYKNFKTVTLLGIFIILTLSRKGRYFPIQHFYR